MDDSMRICKFCGKGDELVLIVPIATKSGVECMHKDCGEKNVDNTEFQMLLDSGRSWEVAMSSARYTRRRNESYDICYEK